MAIEKKSIFVNIVVELQCCCYSHIVIQFYLLEMKHHGYIYSI